MTKLFMQSLLPEVMNKDGINIYLTMLNIVPMPPNANAKAHSLEAFIDDKT